MRGKALQEALQWATSKSLSNQDTRYLAASQEIEKRELAEALATQEEEARILAAANDTLNQAQKKSQRLIRFGSGFLALSLVGAIVVTVWADNARKQLTIARLELTATNLLGVPSSAVTIDTLSEAIRTARELKSLAKEPQSFADYPAHTPIVSLQYALSNIRERDRFEGHTAQVIGVAISPDGKTLASASRDNTLKLWNLDLDDLLTQSCDYLQEYLATRDEEREDLCPGQ